MVVTVQSYFQITIPKFYRKEWCSTCDTAVFTGYVRKDILANHISKKHGPEMVPLEMRPQQKPKPVQVREVKFSGDFQT